MVSKQELAERIELANHQALETVINSLPILCDIQTAGEYIHGMKKNWLCHAGPPIGWKEMTGSAKGAIIGALLYEGLAKTPKDAEALAGSGDIEFFPNHHFNGVGGMTGIVGWSTPLYIINNQPYQIKAYAGMLASPLMFGGYDQQTLEAVKWTNDILAPALKRVVKLRGGINIKSIQARALHMGDELHNRSNAATALFAKEVAPCLAESVDDRKVVVDILRFFDTNDGFFTPIGMAACKATMLAAHNIECSTIVTTMTRNGVEFGIRVSGLGNTWFTGPAAPIKGPTFAGFKNEEVERDIGDSCITETAGLGAFVMAGAPAMLRLVGGSVAEAHRYTQDMYEITVGENPHFTIPNLDFRGGPVGIDIRKIVETGQVPIIDTAMTHKRPGVGKKIGAGIVVPPMEPFEKALRAFAQKYG